MRLNPPTTDMLPKETILRNIKQAKEGYSKGLDLTQIEFREEETPTDEREYNQIVENVLDDQVKTLRLGGTIYEYSFLMPGDAPTSAALGGGAGPVTDNEGPGYGNDGFYARAFVSVESETGGLVSTNNMVADDETFYVDSVGPDVVGIDLEPG